jgi:hypothetical protein
VCVFIADPLSDRVAVGRAHNRIIGAERKWAIFKRRAEAQLFEQLFYGHFTPRNG